jgi:transcriptional regulator with XRE-family HTH domain
MILSEKGVVNMYLEKFAERFNLIRKSKNISSYKIAKHLGIVQSGVIKYGQGIGTPKFENLCKLADLFGVSLDYLVGRTDKPDVNK